MKFRKSDVAGMVTLYNSSPGVTQNIQTYINQIDKLYVVDNSDSPDSAVIEALGKFPNIYYISNEGNLGIAFALNMAASKALQEGYRFLLTMDDDSQAPIDLIERMLHFLQDQDYSSIGILSVNHSITKSEVSFASVLYTMTSGNLLNLEIYKLVGPFCDDLFIDHVDHEYGLRLNSHEFKVIELADLYLRHKLGVNKQVDLFGRSYNFISHNSLRMYYMSRNGVYVALQYWKRYPIFLFTVLKLINKDIIKAIFFENQKLPRLKSIAFGVVDGFRGKLGRKDN